MPSDDSPSGQVLEALGYALFVRDESGKLRIEGDAPEWLAQLWPAVATRGAELPVSDASPFLENFLIDADECWRAGGARRAESGPWVEQDSQGAEMQLQARAMTAGGRACLLVERLGEAFATQVAVLQKARETVIAMHRLDAEIQKKQILVHCLAEDFSRELANIVTALRLIELEKQSPKSSQLLNLALRSAEEQRGLIDKVLSLFPEELKSLYGSSTQADLQRALATAIENVRPHFSEKGVLLSLPEQIANELRILADDAHIERVAGNLLRNVLEHTAKGAEVVVRISEEADAVQMAIEFPHELPHSLADASFGASPESFLRLRFCRIAVESCHGEMGFRPREGGGAAVWVRLPKWSGKQ